MLTFHELHNITEVVAVNIEMSLWTGKGQTTRRVRG